MRKSARNEHFKLKATFFNNLATAFMIAGLIGPFFYVQNTEQLRNMTIGQVVASPAFWPILETLGVTIILTLSFRAFANHYIDKIED